MICFTDIVVARSAGQYLKYYFNGGYIPQNIWLDSMVERKKVFAEARSEFSANPRDVCCKYLYARCLSFGFGTPVFASTGARLMKEAADVKYPPAVKDYGELLSIGLGTTKNQRLAAAYFSDAADNGYAPAESALGLCYMEGKGVLLDVSRAVYWLMRAADRNYPNAQYNLGCCYISGIGVPRSRERAAYWFGRSVKGGFLPAEGAFRRLKRIASEERVRRVMKESNQAERIK